MSPDAELGAQPTAVAVSAYRELIAELTASLNGALEQNQVADASEAIEARIYATLSLPEASPVVTLAAGNAEALTARSVQALRNYRPTDAGTAQSPVEMVTILLLQQIDLAWWRDTPDFNTAADVAAAALLNLRTARRAGKLEFRFSLASDRLSYRARNYAIRRWQPQLSPGTPGPSSPYARPEVIEVLNRIARTFRQVAGSDAPPLWVNSITRPLDVQRRLQELGFTAHIPSAHCRGWAADIEVAWYEHHGTQDVLVDILSEFCDAGIINAIDEGCIWHITPSPDFVRTLSVHQLPR